MLKFDIMCYNFKATQERWNAMFKNVLLNQIFPNYDLDRSSFLDCQKITKGLLNSTYVVSIKQENKIQKY